MARVHTIGMNQNICSFIHADAHDAHYKCLTQLLREKATDAVFGKIDSSNYTTTLLGFLRGLSNETDPSLVFDFFILSESYRHVTNYRTGVTVNEPIVHDVEFLRLLLSEIFVLYPSLLP